MFREMTPIYYDNHTYTNTLHRRISEFPNIKRYGGASNRFERIEGVL
jgi:hypothetical protein